MNRKLLACGLALCLAATPLQALDVGGKCFVKRDATPVLAAPDRTAATVTTAPWAAELKIVEMNGRWLKVKGRGIDGWVFGGNVAPDKPPKLNETTMQTAAGETGAAVAARPLSQEAKDYAGRKSAGEAAADIEWMEGVANSVNSQLGAYQQQNSKGTHAQ
jgi:hypothetical protein